jgi:hypothetical protein
MNDNKTEVRNWIPDGDGYIFMFAKNSEAVGVKVEMTNGVIREDEHDQLHQVSEHIIRGGLPDIGIESNELEPLSREDYLSDKYTHPADDLFEEIRRMKQLNP